MARLVDLVIPLLVMLAACQKESKLYCDQNPGQDGCPDPDASGSSRPACSASPDCKTAELPVCDTTKEGGQCVACTQADHGACGGMTPRCENDSCVACIDDGDCPSSVCLLNGACADAATVVHAVATGGASTSDCGQPLPLGQGACTLEQALSNARGKGPTVIKLDDNATYAPANNNFRVEPDADIVLDLRAGATLTRRSTSDGAVITVNGTGNASGKLTMLGGTISGGHSGGSNPGDGVACTSNGPLIIDQTRITANDASAINTTSCTATITRAQIDNNNQTGTLTPAIRISNGSVTLVRSTIQNNRGGGLDIGSATFIVVGNVFAGNGSTGNVGGITINTEETGNRLEFNSIAENKSQSLVAAGLSCAAGPDFVAANNIIWNNNSALTATSIQVSGCRQRYSDIGPTTFSNALDAGNNKNTNPMFVNATSDLHLTAASPLSDLAADSQASITGVASLDIDGNLRSVPATMGADQPRAN